MAARIGLGIVVFGILAGTAASADPTRTAISCTGNSTREMKTFNVPAKTTEETRLYVIDYAAKSIGRMVDGELVPACDKATPTCVPNFLPAAIKIDYRESENAETLFYYKTGNKISEQTETVADSVTFEGRCQPADLPAAAAK